MRTRLPLTASKYKESQQNSSVVLNYSIIHRGDMVQVMGMRPGGVKYSGNSTTVLLPNTLDGDNRLPSIHNHHYHYDSIIATLHLCEFLSVTSNNFFV